MKVSMSAVWDRTTEFLSDHLAAVGLIAGLTIFAPNAIKETLAPLKAAGSAALWGLGALALILGILSLWGQLAIAALAIDPAAGAPAARARATRRLPATIAVLLAVLLVAILLTLPVVATLVANGVDVARLSEPGASPDLPPGAQGFIAFYGLALIPVGLWLVARFVALATPVVLAERRTLGAFGRAWRLSRGLTWRIIGVALLYGIVMWVATLAATTVFGSLFALLFQPQGTITLAGALTALTGAVVATIFSVMGTVFPAKLYLAVRAREDAIAP